MKRLSQELESLANDLEAYRDSLKEILINKKIDCANTTSLSELINKINLLPNSITYTKINTPMTTDDFNSFGTYTNHTKTLITGYNNTAGIAIVGTSSMASGSSNPTGYLRYEIKMDLTNVSQIKFHARKPANHGVVHVYVTNNGATTAGLSDTSVYLKKIQIHYNDINNTWVEYTIDVSDLTGVKTIVFVGGYIDASGLATSRTEYSNIRLI